MKTASVRHWIGAASLGGRLLISMALLACGCRHAQPTSTYQTAPVLSHRDRDSAKSRNEQGLAHIQAGDYPAAEEAFREALRADLSFAPAHNNLANTLLARGKFYEAALELSFAMNLDRRAVEPVINLGRLYEAAGWLEAAVAEYEKALALDEGSVEAMGRLAHVSVRVGREQEDIEPLLRALAGAAADDAWRSWALAQLEQGENAKPDGDILQ